MRRRIDLLLHVRSGGASDGNGLPDERQQSRRALPIRLRHCGKYHVNGRVGNVAVYYNYDTFTKYIQIRLVGTSMN